MTTEDGLQVTRLDDAIPGRWRFRLVGEPTAPDWQAVRRPEQAPWCELTVYADGHVGSYGGEVWPLGWPEWFEAIPATVAHGSGGVRLTERGRVALGVEPWRLGEGKVCAWCAPMPERRRRGVSRGICRPCRDRARAVAREALTQAARGLAIP